MLIGDAKERLEKDEKITFTEDIAEWDYGDYEGLKPQEIKELREKQGMPKWDIWREGCPGGETAEQVTERLERLIEKIYKIQEPHMDGGDAPDVLVVAHGHILRAFTKRWLRYAMEVPFSMMMEPGAIGIMSYAHHNVKEPAILVGMGFPLQS